MLRRGIVITFVALGCILATKLCANETTAIREYIQATFPANLQLSTEQLDQLSWSVKHKFRSFDLDMQQSNQAMHMEVSRSLTRLYCLQLLKKGDRNSYEQFVKAQLKTHLKEPLSFASFRILSQHIQQLSIESYNLLETATILSGVSLSAPASDLAQNLSNLEQVGNDKLNFLAVTLRSDVNIYPLTEQMQHSKDTSKKMLYILFPPQTNLRHMLYTEGGAGMFNYLRSMIKHQYINRDELNLWYGFWIVNMSGFRGHVDQRGSIYLSEPVFKAMSKLAEHIYLMLDQPSYDPLTPYLEYRAELLGFQALPLQRRLTLAHLGAMLRLYNQQQGQELQRAVAKLPIRVQTKLQQQYMQYLQDPTKLSPTHAPALFGNALQLCNGDIEEVVRKITPIYVQALHRYSILLQNKNLKTGTILSFNNISASSKVEKILQSKLKIKVWITPEGDVAMV